METHRRKLRFESLEERRMLTRLSVADISLVNEDSGTFSATIRLSQATTLPVSVTVTSSESLVPPAIGDNIRAAAGTDFVVESKVVNFPVGTTRQAVQFQIVDDNESEPNESFFLDLTDAVNATIVDRQAEVAIFDDDAAMFFSTKREIPSSLSTVLYLQAADINSDGHVDFLATSRRSGELYWYESDGASGYTEHLITDQATRWTNINTADFDGDGDTDLVTITRWDESGITSPAEMIIRWYENDGNENFTARDISGPTGGTVEVADLDADGDMDILVGKTQGSAPRVAWLENDGGGTFVEHAASPTYNGFATSAADIDGDGDLDLLAASRSFSQPEFSWFENDGSEGFTRHAVPTSLNGVQRMVRAADMDGDGDIDLYAGFVLITPNDYARSTIEWYENEGPQGFTEHEISSGVANNSLDVRAADLDADGDADLVSASTAGHVEWIENNGSGEFVSRRIEALRALDAHPFDFDGDGDLDILVGGTETVESTASPLGWFENQDEDIQRPVASLAAVDSSALLDGYVTVTVMFDDNVGVAPFDLDSNDLEVVSPTGIVGPVEFVSRSTDIESPNVTGTFRVATPNGIWENGSYTVRMRDTQVSDTSGRHVLAGDIGTFSVSPVFACDFVGGDNGCDNDDLNALYAGTNGAPTPLTELVIDQWLVQASSLVNPAKGNPAHIFVAGDVDLDGDVDSIDLGRLLNNFEDTSGLTWESGNLNADAVIDSVDLGRLLNSFGFESLSALASLATSASAVVEEIDHEGWGWDGDFNHLLEGDDDEDDEK